MSIRFDCVSCNKNIVVHDRFEGRSVRCPACNIDLTVPKRSAPAQEISQDDESIEAEDDVTEVEEVVDADLIDESGVTAQVDDETNGDEADAEGDESELEDEELVSSVSSKHKRSRSIRGDHDEAEEDLEWDITPMVDVAFLLLIFFMLTASFSIQKVIRTSTPQTDQPSSNATQTQEQEVVESIIVQVDEFNAYTVVSSSGETLEASSKQELAAILKDLRIQFGEQSPRVVIQAHVDSMHGATVGCMDAAREADFTKFQMFAVETFD